MSRSGGAGRWVAAGWFALAQGLALLPLVGQGLGGAGLDGRRTPLPSEMRTELAQLQSKHGMLLDQRDRMVDLLTQHALGWSVSEATAMMVGRVLDATERDQARIRLADLERQLASLHGEYRRLKQETDAVAAPVAEVDQDGGADWEDMPRVETLPDSGGGSGGGLDSGTPTATGTANGGTGAPSKVEDDDDDDERMFALMKGSEDHGAVGRLLFLAGRSLHRQGNQLAAEGRAAEAAEVRGRARRKYQQGVRELRQATLGGTAAWQGDSRSGDGQESPAMYPATAAYIDLFHEGRCLLGLFDLDIEEGALGLALDTREYEARIEAVRRPLLTITSRDVDATGPVPKLGNWGAAAEAMLDQIRWRMNQDGYEPTLPDISWRGEPSR